MTITCQTEPRCTNPPTVTVDVITWTCYWTFVSGIHRSTVKWPVISNVGLWCFLYDHSTNNLLNKQPSWRWFETPWSSWDVTVMQMPPSKLPHYIDVIMGAMASQITGVSIVYSSVCQTSKLRVTGFCEGNSPVTGEFLSQMASNAENVSIFWCHHGYDR